MNRDETIHALHTAADTADLLLLAEGDEPGFKRWLETTGLDADGFLAYVLMSVASLGRAANATDEGGRLPLHLFIQGLVVGVEYARQTEGESVRLLLDALGVETLSELRGLVTRARDAEALQRAREERVTLS